MWKSRDVTFFYTCQLFCKRGGSAVRRGPAFIKNSITMVTDEMIRKQFVHQTLSQGIGKIYQTQQNVVGTYLQQRSGQLQSHLMRRPFNSESADDRTVFYVRILPYLRFLDISYRRGRTDRVSRHIRSQLALYNRVVWGVLYHETFPELRYGFSQQIREGIRQQLEQAVNPGKTS